MEGLSYAQRLQALNMYSVQRRHETYKIIYLYKIKCGLVPNISEHHGLQFYPNKRFGTSCWVPSFPLYNNRAIKARNASFALTASSLWNSLPKKIRNISEISVEAFKRRLDKVLKEFPDVPRCSSQGMYTDLNGRISNSIQDIAKKLKKSK